MLVGPVDFTVKYLNKLTWPRAETKKTIWDAFGPHRDIGKPAGKIEKQIFPQIVYLKDSKQNTVIYFYDISYWYSSDVFFFYCHDVTNVFLLKGLQLK